MQQVIEYIKTSLKPRNQQEWVESISLTEFACKINNLKQDGIAILSFHAMTHEMAERFIAKKGEWVIIGTYLLFRKNQPNQIEWLQPDGSFQFSLSSSPLYRRLIPPPWETVDHAFIIKKIIQETNGSTKNYIEYGVRTGECIETIAPYVKHAYGIDTLPYSPKKTNITHFTMYTDTFSQTYLPTITFDYAFIDADHSSKQVLVDFDYLYKYININGYIFLHDTYPCRIENLQESACNDCYKSPILIKQKYPWLEILTLPLNPGLTVIHVKRQ